MGAKPSSNRVAKTSARSMYAYILLVNLCFVSFFDNCYSQNVNKELEFDHFIEQIFPSPDEDLPYEEIYESLYQYYQAPLNLNKATREEIASLYILSPLQINNFIKYRDHEKFLTSIYELQTIEGFDLNTIHKLLPFIEVTSKTPLPFRGITEKGGKYFQLRYDKTLERKAGYTPGEKKYEGDDQKIFGRFRAVKSKEYSLGFSFEKDAGETLKWNPAYKKYGLDFWSYHLMIENKGNLKKLIVGDYQIQFGQGLITGAGFSSGKGGEAIMMVRRYNTGLRPYTSSVENGFSRGIASTYSLKLFDLTLFYSNQNVDGAIKSDSSEEHYTESIRISGLHRTESEIAARKKLNKQDIGGNLNMRLPIKNLEIGFTYLSTFYNVPIQERPTRYNQFDFSGKENFNYGFNYSYIYQNFNFFGEIARSESTGMGMITGAMASLSSKVDFTLLYRKYDKSFHSINGNAFGENFKNINEEGFYVGLKVSPIKKITINTYFDRYRKPWLSFQSYGPSEGYEYLGRLQFLPSKTINLFVQIRKEMSEKNEKSEGLPTAKLENQGVLKWLVNVEFKPMKTLQLKSRVQGTTIEQGSYKSSGIALFQDATIDLGRIKMSGRYCLFDTDDFAARQYTYEKDVLYTFSFPALYGEGTRGYFLCEYSLRRDLNFWVKISRTSYTNQENIGSGTEEIKGNQKTDVRIQLKYSF